MADRPPVVIIQGSPILLHELPSTDTLSMGNVAITPEGGIAVRLKNSTGATIAKGKTVAADSGNDDSIVLAPSSSSMPIGVVYADISAGQYGWVVVAGIADVLVDNAGATGRGYWIGVSTTTAGECTSAATVPATTDHFREVGHTIRSRSGAGLVRCVVHFN